MWRQVMRQQQAEGNKNEQFVEHQFHQEVNIQKCAIDEMSACFLAVHCGIFLED